MQACLDTEYLPDYLLGGYSMLKEIARYGSFNKRAPTNEGVSENVDKVMSKPKIKKQKVVDIYDPFAIYDYDIDYEEVLTDEPDIHEQDS